MSVRVYKSRNGNTFVKATQVTCDTEWTLKGKKTMLYEKDYLVKDTDGNLSRYSQEEFEKTYKLI